MKNNPDLSQAIAQLQALIDHVRAQQDLKPAAAEPPGGPWGGLEARILRALSAHGGRVALRTLVAELGETKQRVNHHAHLLSTAKALTLTKEPDPTGPPGRHVLVAWAPDLVVKSEPTKGAKTTN